MIEPNFDKTGGLVPVIVQDAETKDILMLAYMNRASWEATLQSGKATFWSRSRQKLWLKGESSGHVQMIKNIFYRLRRGYDLIAGGTAGRRGLSHGASVLFLPEA